MKKEIKKLLAVMLAFVFIFSLLAINTFAENEEAAETTAAEIVPAENDVQQAPSDDTTADTEKSKSENIFEFIYREAMKHSDKILSLLAFLSSLIVALGYRKTLLPIIKGALSKLSSTLDTASQDAEKRSGEAEKKLNEAKESFEEAKALFGALTENFSSLIEKLDEASKLQKFNSEVKLLIESQIDMLYEVFISSSLPVYQKEAVGEKIAEMKRIIATPEGDEV